MRRQDLRRTPALTLLLALTLTGSVGEGARDAAARAPDPAPATQRDDARHAGTGLLTLDWGDLDSTTTRGADYLVLQTWEFRSIPALRRANPDVVVLAYKNAAAVRKDAHETGLFSTGLSYAEVAATNPSWFLRDPRGTPLEWSDFPGLHPVDLGDRGYQRRWVANVSRDLRRGGFDGVMVDDVLTRLSHPTEGGRTSTRIRTDDQQYRATREFLAHTGPALRRRGFAVYGNLTDVSRDRWQPTFRSWSRYVTGWEHEFFTKWGHDSRSPRFGGPEWRWKSDLAAWCARRRVPLLAVTYAGAGDRVAQTYHRATWLLTWNGRTGASIYVPAEAWTDHRRRAAMVHLGAPRGRPVVTAGVHRRTYSRGLVLVNPTDQRRAVRLASRWRLPSGEIVRTTSLAPRSGALLRRP